MKLLELKGRDRDKLIALKKGYEVCLCSDCKSDPNKQLISKGLRRLFPLKHWSTDRNDAWELFKELPYAVRKEVISAWAKWGFNIDYFADAVSKAWLRWFYNTQWLKEVNNV